MNDRKSQAISYTAVKVDGKETEFLGYSETEAESKVQHIVEIDGKDSFSKGDTVSLVF